MIETLWETSARTSAPWALGCALGWFEVGQTHRGDLALDQALQLSPDWVVLFEEQARVQAGRQHMAEAVRAAQRVIELHDSPDATRQWSEFIGHQLFSGGRRREALPHLLRGEPQVPTWLYWYRRAVCSEQVEDPTDAAACYRRAADLRVPTVSAELRTAALHYYQGAIPQVVAQLDRLSAPAPSRQAETERILWRSRALLRLEHADEAVRHLRSRDRASDSPELAQVAALAEELTGDLDRAVAEYRTAIDRHGLSLQHRLARCQHGLGQISGAVETWLTATDHLAPLTGLDPELDPDFDPSVQTVAAHLDRGDWQAGVAGLRRLAGSASSSDNVRRLHQRLGHALAATGQHELALSAFRRASNDLLPHASEAEASFAPIGKFERYAAAHEALPLDHDTVLYESFQGAQTSCNPLALCQHLLRERPDLHHVWAITGHTPIHESLRGHPRVSFVQIHSDGYRLHLATAGTLITNNSFPLIFVRREGQKYLNTWHGFPWKTMGRDIAGHSFAYGNLARNLLQATHLAFPDEHTARVMTESTDVAHLITAQMMTAGQPRVDRTLTLDHETKQRLRARLGLVSDGPVVLYAPTWRGSIGAVDASVAPYVTAVKTLTRVADAQVLLSLHHLVAKELDHDKLPGNITVVPPDIDTNELLSIVDVLVSDYSSVIFDFAALGRPIIKYVFDHDTYGTNRGLYFSIDDVPGTSCTDEAQLLEAVTCAAQGADATGWSTLPTASAWLGDDGHVTGRIVRALFDHEVPEPADQVDPERVLISAKDRDPHATDQETGAFLAAHPETAQHVQLMVDKFSVDQPENARAVSSLHQHVDFTLVMDQRCATRRENLAWARLEACDQPITGTMLAVLQSRMTRERRRMFGRSRFEEVLDLGGHDLHRTALTALGFPEETTTIHLLRGDVERESSEPLAPLDPALRLMGQFDVLASPDETTRSANERHLAAMYSVSTALHQQAADPLALVARSRTSTPTLANRAAVADRTEPLNRNL